MYRITGTVTTVNNNNRSYLVIYYAASETNSISSPSTSAYRYWSDYTSYSSTGLPEEWDDFTFTMRIDYSELTFSGYMSAWNRTGDSSYTYTRVSDYVKIDWTYGSDDNSVTLTFN